MREPTRRRSASDLYALGVPLVLDDGATEWLPQLDDEDNPVIGEDGQEVLVEEPLPPITLWVAKLSDIEMTTAMKKAARAQATVMAGRKSHDSDDWLAIHAEMGNLDRETWLGILVGHEMENRRELIEARIAGETIANADGEDEPNEWGKDNYLEGLRDAWLDGLNATYAVDPGDPDAQHVLAEIERFNAVVDKELEFETEIEKGVLESLSDDFLLEKVTDLMIEAEGQSAWADEYRLWIIALAARDCEGPDPRRPGLCLCRGQNRKHTELHFKDGIEEVRVTDGQIRTTIYVAWNAVMVDVREGKELRAAPSSSQRSGSPGTEATSDSSGLADATA